ncbi:MULTISPECIES: glycoside hydrolase family 99-like domain-containing protein [Aphanothece]|uniref:glycoside hydrolase family 99-like domain-containing protein n=1 Tax=Aphanothece TaxID=1121 RepID=UPI003984B846
MIQHLDSHSSVQAKEAFDEDFFLEINSISRASLNGVSGFAYFQVHYQLCDLKARYDYGVYQRRLQRLIALGKCPSKFLTHWARLESAPHGKKQYYYPPAQSDLKALGLKAKEVDMFATPEVFTSILIEFLTNADGVLAKPQLIQMIPRLLRVPEIREATLWNDQLVNKLLELLQERSQASLLSNRYSFSHGRPKDIDAVQIETIRSCFDSDYYALNYNVQNDDEEEINSFDFFVSEGRHDGHSPCEFFDYQYYIGRYWRSIPGTEDAYYYYLTRGWKLGHDPSRRFPHKLLSDLAASLDLDSNGPVGKILKNNYPCSVLLKNMEGGLSPSNSRYNKPCDIDPSGAKRVQSLISSTPSVHAYYLTQYHPISENDENWGKGFTEWTNVTKALPYFLGHNQPKLPLEGFYDLRVDENLSNQSILAKEYGVDSFCFYFYWFQGKRVLEKPLDSLISRISSDQSFTLLWANENWTRNWDGQNDDVIISQSYGDEDCERFCRDIAQYLTHPSYYRIDNKAVFYIYRPSSIPDFHEWVSRLREYFSAHHNLELLIGIVQYLPYDKSPKLYSADLILQFPPNGYSKMTISKPPPKILRPTSNDYIILDYMSMVDENHSMDYPSEVVRTSFAAWDSSPRKKQGWAAFVGGTPDEFQYWLTSNIRSTSLDNSLGLTMVNAWNEWAEGACLEPDRHYGYEYLHAVRDARLHFALEEESFEWKATLPRAIVAHIYYDESIDRVAKRLEPYIGICDIYVTTHPKGLCVRAAKIFAVLPDARLFVTENRGRDVGPFIKLLNIFHDLGIEYDYICKIHGKASHHRSDGIDWFNDITEKLLPSSLNGQEELLRFLESHNCDHFGLLAPSGHIVNLKEYIGGNQYWVDRLLDFYSGSKSGEPTSFVAGTMFWIGRSVCRKLVNHFTPIFFQEEYGQLDETLAHGYERMFLWLAGHMNLASYTSDYEVLDYTDTGEVRYLFC